MPAHADHPGGARRGVTGAHQQVARKQALRHLGELRTDQPGDLFGGVLTESTPTKTVPAASTRRSSLVNVSGSTAGRILDVAFEQG